MMIRILFLLFFILSQTNISFSQTSRGSIMLGGQVSANVRGANEGKILMGDVSPDLLVFVQNNLAVGGSVELGVIRYPGSRYNSFGIFPTARYFFGKNQAGRVFLLGNLGYHLTSFTFESRGTARSGLGLGGGPGFAYFFNESVALEGLAKAQGIRYTDGSNSLQLQFRTGVHIYLKPRRF